jgi:hypothetical protein
MITINDAFIRILNDRAHPGSSNTASKTFADFACGFSAPVSIDAMVDGA